MHVVRAGLLFAGLVSPAQTQTAQPQPLTIQQAVAEAISLGEKSGIDKQLLLNVLGETTVISPSHKSKLENVRKEEYPANFALPLMCKDFELIQQQAAALSVPMPATAAAQQMYNAAQAKASQANEEDYAAVVRFMEELAGLSVHTS